MTNKLYLENFVQQALECRRITRSGTMVATFGLLLAVSQHNSAKSISSNERRVPILMSFHDHQRPIYTPGKRRNGEEASEDSPPSPSSPRVHYHLGGKHLDETSGGTKAAVERRKREGREGGIKDSTLRYNKVHPWKPLPLPSLLHGSSITPFNLLCSSTLLIFPSVLGDPATLSCLRHSSLPPLQLACIYISGEGGGTGGRRGEETGKRVGRGFYLLRGFLVTGNLKICLRVVEPPEETLLLAPILLPSSRAPPEEEKGGRVVVVAARFDEPHHERRYCFYKLICSRGPGDGRVSFDPGVGWSEPEFRGQDLRGKEEGGGVDKGGGD